MNMIKKKKVALDIQLPEFILGTNPKIWRDANEN